ncbi:MAG: CDP-diacylglycerol--glycerol-3-phosphate 3-phosphatidyltransferase [Candidatus Fonsibacter sp.]|nr:CDP-diacylglycerol--glycerol-3-phosphate 3-phosphatidyltransferase [Candidatus Fonsibacter sp.]
MKIPNILTIGRILIAPILVIIFYFPGELSDWLSCAIFAIAAFTDYLDGFFARLYKQQSKFGELLDPIADKVLVATALALLIMSQTVNGIHVVAAIIIITREILISGLREFLAKGQVYIPVTNLSKGKTILQMIAISILLAGDSGDKFLFNYGIQLGIYLLWISAILTLWTGYAYLRKGIDLID